MSARKNKRPGRSGPLDRVLGERGNRGGGLDRLVENLGEGFSRLREERARAAGNKPRNRNAQFNLRNRLILVGGALGLCSLALLGRALDLQVISNDFYRQQGDARSLREIPIPTSRGMITDRNGEPLAVSTPVESIWGNPKELAKSPERLPELAKALGVAPDELTRKLSQRSGKEFMYLKRRINPDEARKILAYKIPGVFSQREFRRFYPQGEAMAHVLGFTNIDDRGQEGLELAFDHELRGKPGTKRVIRDGAGRIVENVDLVQSAEPGKDITLTLDRRIQYLTYRELRRALIDTGASSASAVVLDIETGEVLAMANLPTYNPNMLGAGNRDTHRNRAITDVVEPGSTMKPITVAAALNAGTVKPTTLVNTSPGWMPNGRYRITDTHNNGVLTVTGVITKSSNIGAAKLALPLPNDYFYKFIRNFGYGSKPGSGFPGESSGLLAPPQRWSGTTKATMAYGYGLSATPMQIAIAYAAMANGGKMIQPTFVKGQSNEAHQVLDPVVAGEIMHMMQTVTEPGGTAKQAAILGYHVAGKTGTTRKFSATGGYSKKYVSLFAGVVPVEKPRFSMVVVVSEPDPTKRGYYGGSVSGPVFRNVMDGALRLMDVAPDDIETWLAVQAAAEAKRLKLNGGKPTGPVVPAATAAAHAVASPPPIAASSVAQAAAHGGAR
ncbi:MULTISPECIES: penicillin-binding protein 2 [unclassified Lysobacter]|uniref:peptidoglycan D,D-transpeptidase FtsI family protein n=1 Tax=unclassified Lysobacter TaxID=2635362 RepID=UPI001BEB9EE3|nr:MULTISPECIES: penicillin-binding protein 2 [unclassified Lysobacter]MBT2747897.1 penicillin-binding protein 2 [Lysobacter sp. ISL-42]MBT2753763.1 penicillin-binding protein 2 [Lysobacter sp. ISL-50]MBT2779051.1 penicillin-binding protein 2 [Lysobacter sp. ISL-54]